MRAELATTMDVPSWSEIVREVEPLFGSMPDFEAMLIREIDQGAALCIRSKACPASTTGAPPTLSMLIARVRVPIAITARDHDEHFTFARTPHPQR
jgi:hypothetical protein